jgi:hypothetical protein
MPKNIWLQADESHRETPNGRSWLTMRHLA